jgi:hypothetical protein
MNRFYILSISLHLIIFAVFIFANRAGFKPIPEFEVYKVSIAPLPQPKIVSMEESVKQRKKHHPSRRLNLKKRKNQKLRLRKLSRKDYLISNQRFILAVAGGLLIPII